MDEKIRVAFPYKSSNKFLSGKHFDNTYFHFLVTALKRNQNVDVTFFPVERDFDTRILEQKFDVILLWSNADYGNPEELIGINKLKIPVIARVGDPRDAKHAIKNHEKFQIDHYFHFWSKPFFHKFYPKDFKFKTIIFGLEPSIYENVTSFNSRIKDKILNSGAVGNTKPISRIINSIRDPKFNALSVYKLRTKCNSLPYVDYTSTLKHKFVNDKYSELLQRYRACIACSTLTFVAKMVEIPAAGSISFLEVTKKNKCEYVGFKDNQTAIFIDDDNYKDKFQEYLSDLDNPKWEKIANQGREFVMNKLNNDTAVMSLVELMKEVINN